MAEAGVERKKSMANSMRLRRSLRFEPSTMPSGTAITSASARTRAERAHDGLVEVAPQRSVRDAVPEGRERLHRRGQQQRVRSRGRMRPRPPGAISSRHADRAGAGRRPFRSRSCSFAHFALEDFQAALLGGDEAGLATACPPCAAARRRRAGSRPRVVGRLVSSSTSSARYTASSRSCETSSMVVPVCMNTSCSFSRMNSVISKSSAENGSSRNSTSGSVASARMIDAVCCWPPDSS